MINIPRTDKKRVVIVGCGFAGLTLAKKLKNKGYQVVILDKHNYHQFPPLFYQVASAGLEESSILFPLRKIFQHYKDFHLRKVEVKSVDTINNIIKTSSGEIDYDFLVLAHGATNNYFGSAQMQKYSRGMKTIAEVLDLRNSLLMNFENALTAHNSEEREMLMTIVIIGGGPSGVEIAGALSELPKVRFQGIFAWFVWMFVHLMSIIGVKNKLLIFMNWAFKYFTYDQSTRLILRPKGCADISSNNYSIPE